MLLTLINTLIALYGGLSPIELYPDDYGPNLKNGDEFDFIVVGAGSAGSVVASRLSEISEWKVLVLEAGGYPSGLSEVPSMAMSLQNTDEDWQYTMEPSETCCLGTRGKVCGCPRGKALGGSSSINFMMYTRSTRYDHDRWVSYGNEDWDYDTIEKYYKKFEHVHIDDNKCYGTDGELHLTRYTSRQPIRQILSNGYEELGLQEYTEDNPVGFRDLLLSVHKGTRQNTAKAFLIPARDRKNLHVAINSQVSRILIAPEDLTATALGVEVKINDQLIQIKAKKEVILAAGAINSPQILLNSGIGPKEHLSKIGIDTVRDLPVGKNYQDHLCFPHFVQVDQSAVNAPTILRLMSELYKFFTDRTGELATLDLLNFSTYFNTKNLTNFSNVQVLHTITYQNDAYFLDEVFEKFRTPQSVSAAVRNKAKESPLISFTPILLQPKSYGHIELRNSDPFSKPVITPNFLSDKNGEDLDALLDAVKFSERLIRTKAFSAYNPKFVDQNITNCREFELYSDGYWKCAIRNIPFPIYHPVGTCKMGPSSDPTAVVDSQLKVHGLQRLRVIDASVMPVVPSCNTNAPTIMIGERGADFIKADWINIHDEL